MGGGCLCKGENVENESHRSVCGGAVCGAGSLHPAQLLGPCVMLDGPQFPRGCSTATVPVR